VAVKLPPDSGINPAGENGKTRQNRAKKTRNNVEQKTIFWKRKKCF